MRLFYAFCTIAIATLLTTSCSTGLNLSSTKSKPKTDASISGQTWFLINDKNVVKGLYDHNISFTIDENNNVTGFSGCNNFSATFSKVGEVSNFSNFSETKMACPNLKDEQSFLSILKNINRYEIVGKELHFYKGNILLIKFKTT